jgi:transcriptional regulator with XRE-family HTH domain
MQKSAQSLEWKQPFGMEDGKRMTAVTDGMRAYLREVRIQRGVSQRALAEAMGLSLRALIDWESGKTDDLKSTSLFRAASFLRASLDDIRTLIEAGADEAAGRQRATAWLSQAQERRIDRLVEEDDDDSLMAAIEEMRAELDRLAQRVDSR